MKRICIIVTLLIISWGIRAQMTAGNRFIEGPMKDGHFASRDTVKKRSPFPHPPSHQPSGYHTAAVERKVPPYATLHINTEIPSTLYYDGVKLAHVTPSHIVLIKNTPAGSHSLGFSNHSMDYKTIIEVRPGEQGLYMLRKDTTVQDSVSQATQVSGHHQKIKYWYIPFSHAYSFQFIPGWNFDGSGGGYNLRFIAGYWFSKIKLGLGTGMISYSTHLEKTANVFNGYESLNTMPFDVVVIPVFADLTVVLSKKRTTPFLTFDLGVSIPAQQNINIYLGSYHSPTYIEIKQVNPGFYFGMAFGVKTFISPAFEVAASFGFDGSVNVLKGTFHKDYWDGTVSDNSYDGNHTSAAWYLNLAFAFNLEKKRH
jgi:hypothetical protein